MPSRLTCQWSWDSDESQEVFVKTVGLDGAEKSYAQVKQIEKMLALQPCKMIDIGCGNGRQTQIFARFGYEVCGIDISERFLAEAQKNAKNEHLSVQYQRMRASQLQQCNEFDFALAYHHSIGFLPDDELPLHFYRIYECLKPGGVFLFEMAGPKLCGKTPSPFRDWQETDDQFVLVDKKIQDGYREEVCILIDKSSGDVKEFREKQRAFSLAALKKILKQAGFQSIQCYADLQKTPATKANFGIFVCIK